MAIKKVGGRTLYIEDGYFPKEVVDAMNKRLAEEEKAKSGDGKKPAKKPAQKPEEKPVKKSK